MRAGRRERKRERECESSGAAQHSRSLTDIDPRPNPSQFPSYVVTSNYVLLHLESSMFQQRHPKAATVLWAHVYAAQTVKKQKTGKWRYACIWVFFFMSTINFFFCPNASNPWGECATLCYNISIWGEDECIPFFIPHPSLPPPSFSFSLSPIGWKLLSGWQKNLTVEMQGLRRHSQKTGVYFQRVCFLWWITYIQNSSLGDPSSVSYYIQGYWEKRSLSVLTTALISKKT